MGATNFSQAVYVNVKDSKASTVSLPYFSVTPPADVVRGAIARAKTGTSAKDVNTRSTRLCGTSRGRERLSSPHYGKPDLATLVPRLFPTSTPL